jgi:hypothetical protein
MLRVIAIIENVSGCCFCLVGSLHYYAEIQINFFIDLTHYLLRTRNFNFPFTVGESTRELRLRQKRRLFVLVFVFLFLYSFISLYTYMTRFRPYMCDTKPYTSRSRLFPRSRCPIHPPHCGSEASNRMLQFQHRIEHHRRRHLPPRDEGLK